MNDFNTGTDHEWWLIQQIGVEFWKEREDWEYRMRLIQRELFQSDNPVVVFMATSVAAEGFGGMT